MADKVFKMHFDDEPVIRTICAPVADPTDPQLGRLVKEMVQYLKDSQDPAWAKGNHVRAGVGLAAPQIGDPRRFFAVYVDLGKKGGIKEYGLVNPVILKTSVRQCCLSEGEGCLSVAKDRPGYVPRYYRITVKAYDVLEGREVTINQVGYPAIIFQHELDHLDGHLYYDHIDKIDPWKEIAGITKI